MNPRWTMWVLFALAGVPLTLPSVLGLFVDLPVAVADGLHLGGALTNVAILVVSLLDLVISARLRLIDVDREVSDVMSVGARNAVKLWLTNRNRIPIQIQCHDDPPLPCDVDDLPFTIVLTPRKVRFRVYHVKPTRRGPNRFGDIYLKSISRLRLWTFFDQRPLAMPVKVFPDIQQVHGMELLSRRNRLAEQGIKLTRLRGRGSEFDRLREYREEDEYRHIDWKATARHDRLVSREFVVERNQNILLLVDCGRSMCNEHNGMSHLDRALNAAILLSYVANKQADNVAFCAFSNRIERSIRYMRGTQLVQTIVRQVYDLEPRYEATDYSLMVEHVKHNFRKRSLVVLITHALDDLHLKSIIAHMRQLKMPHLVLGAILRSPLHYRVQQVPATDVEAFQVAAAANMLLAQTRQLAELKNSGLLSLEVAPEDLTPHLISQYLDIKARHLL